MGVKENVMNKKHLRKILGIMIILASMTGIVINIITSDSLKSALSLLNYFTIQSNLIVAGLIAWSLIKGFEDKKSVWLGAATIWILITGLIYHFFLFELHGPRGIHLLISILLHYVVPISMLTYYLFLVEKPHEKVSWLNKIMTWGIYPLVYTAISLIRGRLTGFYPYWFLNPEKAYPDGIGSYGNILIFVVVAYLAFIIIGLIIEFAKYLFEAEKEENATL